MAERDSDVGKVFVGGISRETNEETLREHFSKYGDVASTSVAIDRLTGTPRGFGFVTFTDPSSLHFVLSTHPHLIAGRPVEVKKAIPRNEQQQSITQQQSQRNQQQQSSHSQTSKPSFRNSNNGSSYGGSNNDQSRSKKIFVGGLSASLTEEEFKNYFEKFGRITDVVVMHDNTTNRPRGFGFITFDSEEVVEQLMQRSHHELSGKLVEVKRAVPREATKNFGNGKNSRSGGSRFSPSAVYPDDGSWMRPPTPVVNYPSQYPVSTTYPAYYYGGGYPALGGYGVFGYGMPVVPPGTPWNGVGVMGVRPLPYGTGYYPTGVNGGMALVGMINGYNGVVDTAQVRHQMDGARSGVDSNSRVEKGVVNAKKNSKVPPVGRSI